MGTENRNSELLVQSTGGKDQEATVRVVGMSSQRHGAGAQLKDLVLGQLPISNCEAPQRLNREGKEADKTVKLSYAKTKQRGLLMPPPQSPQSITLQWFQFPLALYLTLNLKQC